MNRIIFFVVTFASCLPIFAAKCQQYGCTRYADPDGYCAFHKKEGQAARAKKAAEKAADREVIRRHEKLERLHAEEDAMAAEAEKSELRKLQQLQRMHSKAEQLKFMRPLDGMLGHKFGETIAKSPLVFTPDAPYHGLTECSLRANGTNGVDRIAGCGSFATEKLAQAKLKTILDDIEGRYDRRPYQIFTKSGQTVYALGFGGTNGMARQQLQIQVRRREKDCTVELVAFVIDNPQKTLVVEEER